jgi:vacuolar-type H+-ATPase subunit I/STV1
MNLPAILAASNVVLAGAVVWLAASSRSTPGTAIESTLQQVEKSLKEQTEATARLNTTLVQYDFLQKELERLGRLDIALAARANAVSAAEKTGSATDAAATLEKIKKVQTQLQAEIQNRKETLIKLIAGLEKNLAATRLDEKALGEVLKTPAPAEKPAAATSPAP